MTDCYTGSLIHLITILLVSTAGGEATEGGDRSVGGARQLYRDGGKENGVTDAADGRVRPRTGSAAGEVTAVIQHVIVLS